MWNTICLPFNLNSNQKVLLFGEGYHLHEFYGIDNDNGVTHLKFRAVAEGDDLAAGIPYIVYPTKSLASEEAEKLTEVVISTPSPQAITINDENGNAFTYQGIYVPTRIDNIKDDPKQVLFIGPDNHIYWPNTSNPLKGFRAYFTLPSSTYSANVYLSTE